MKIIFFGAGYCSKFITQKLPDNIEIICTHNEKIKKEDYDSKKNITRMTLKEFANNQKNIKDITHVLNSIPPSLDGDVILNKFSNFFHINVDTLKWVGFFSATNVYGNHNGKWVDENSKLLPSSQRGKQRLKAEKQYLLVEKTKNIPVHIFRLPGIYGPKRSIFERISSGNLLRIVKKNHYFSRIHVEDIADVVIKSFKSPTPGEVFNVTDDFPCESEKVVDFACNLLGTNRPESCNYTDNRLGEMTKSFYSDNKRVSNKKIKKILNWTPKYSNYKLGLLSIFKNLNK